MVLLGLLLLSNITSNLAVRGSNPARGIFVVTGCLTGKLAGVGTFLSFPVLCMIFGLERLGGMAVSLFGPTPSLPRATHRPCKGILPACPACLRQYAGTGAPQVQAGRDTVRAALA